MGVRNQLRDLHAAWLESGIYGYLLVAVWLLYPVAVVTVFHPADAVGFQAWLQGVAIPRIVTKRMLNVGAGEAVLALTVLSLLQLGLVTLIYRRAQFFVQLWPLAVVLVGGIANGAWWLKTGYFDPWGAMAGLTPVFAAIGCHALCERLGGNFVFGPGKKPSFDDGFAEPAPW
jgi:hypothetical protein